MLQFVYIDRKMMDNGDENISHSSTHKKTGVLRTCESQMLEK